eukprot:TRINITY_DN2485_c0_g1_i1.p1 TRINITY_DN2485_c0_g1~~TRINITY_DN2485_c0_g1_i1.p1  ORF type:complete len:241 (-),score=58.39 TRINITY_DN2485_c0_g1_i1:400-1122(-)
MALARLSSSTCLSFNHIPIQRHCNTSSFVTSRSFRVTVQSHLSHGSGTNFRLSSFPKQTFSDNGFCKGRCSRRMRAVVSEEQPLTAVVSQSDKLTLFFRAEGKLDEELTPKVQQSLEVLDNVSDVKIINAEGVTIVELVKETSIQDTGVSSGLVENLQKTGFKLQSLSLRFEDEEDEEDEGFGNGEDEEDEGYEGVVDEVDDEVGGLEVKDAEDKDYEGTMDEEYEKGEDVENKEDKDDN